MNEPAAHNGEPRRRLTTVLAADICGYSRLAETNESAAVKTVDIVFAIFKNAVTKYHGRVFNRAGDGFFAEFPSVADGVRAALAFTKDIKASDTLSPNSPNAKVRVGLHVGDVVDNADGDLLGHGVNIAARLQSEAEPNGILISLHAVNLVRDKVDAQFQRRGTLVLKNIDEPVVAFDVVEGVSQTGVFSKVVRRVRKLQSNAFVVVALLVVIFASYITLLNKINNGKSNNAEVAVAGERIETLEDEVAALVKAISSKQMGFSDSSQLFAVNDAAKSLLLSPVPEKIAAVADIKADNLDKAAESLLKVYDRQAANGAAINYQLQTLKEIGAIIFHRNTKNALDVYDKAYGLAPDDPLVLNQLAELYYRESDADSAKTTFEALEKAAGDSAYWRLKAEIGLARFYLWKDQPALAKQYIEIALATAREGEFHAEEALCLAYLGTAEKQLGNLNLARKRVRAALKLEDALNNPSRMSAVRRSLGNILIKLDEVEEALDVYHEAKSISEAAGDRASLARIYYALGLATFNLSRTEEALEYFANANEIASAEGMVNLLSYSLGQLSEIAFSTGDKHLACVRLAEARDAINSGATLSASVERYFEEKETNFGCL